MTASPAAQNLAISARRGDQVRYRSVFLSVSQTLMR
jgi:hypothetical protein